MTRMMIHKNSDGSMCLKSFDDIHNHDLQKNPSKVQLLRSYNKFYIDATCKYLVDQFYGCGGLAFETYEAY